MKSLNLIVLGTIFSVTACGGGDSSTQKLTGTASSGEGGGDSVSSGPGTSGSGGNEDGGGSSSESKTSVSSGEMSSSISSGSGGSGGSECIPKVTCQSVGAECGTIQDDGCGNKVECPNNCSGVLTCGGSGDQFKCGCTPKTCDQQGLECGEATDGCGLKLDCGGCDLNNFYLECGGKPAPNSDGTFPPSQPNMCEGGCTRYPAQDANCAGMGKPTKAMLCSKENNTNPPEPGCNSQAEVFLPSVWCCPF